MSSILNAKGLNAHAAESQTNGQVDHPQVAVIGAGPAGLMLATNLVRWGVKTVILDDRPDRTATGRADGIQPKTIETFRQMKLAEPLLRKGVRIYDICFWNSTLEKPMSRTRRDIHYPADIVDVMDPYILILHQGMIEEVFIDDLESRGVSVQRKSKFLKCVENDSSSPAVEIQYEDTDSGEIKNLRADYVVGCDGAHSNVRSCLPGSEMKGENVDVFWGVIDGVTDTDFPDQWRKSVIHSEEAGSILCIPRERNMARLYIELQTAEKGGTLSKAMANQEFVQRRAAEIMKPFRMEWKRVEWFGIYQIGQRITSHFSTPSNRIFIAGDAAHTHSPKAAQGMNVSMHDALNLSWKLKLVIQGLTSPDVLLSTYELERRKVASDLLEFDFEHANAYLAGDAKALAENFRTNIRFISGVGAEYAYDQTCNLPLSPQVAERGGKLRPGSILPPAQVTRYIDVTPVQVQLDIPMLGQYRIYFLATSFAVSKPLLDSTCRHISSPSSFLSRVSSKAAAATAPYSTTSPTTSPTPSPTTSPTPTPTPTTTTTTIITTPPLNETDEFILPERYTTASPIFTYAFITTTKQTDIEVADLPPLLRDSKWTFYLDDGGPGNNYSVSEKRGVCIEKWLGKLADGEVAVVCVRPDGYVGAVDIFRGGGGDGDRNHDGAAAADDDDAAGKRAGEWLEEYFGRFLLV